MVKNLILGMILACSAQIWDPYFFSWVLPLLDVRHCCKLSLYATSRKNNDSNSRKWQKNLMGLILARWAHIWTAKIWLRKSLDIMVTYHHIQNQKKLMILSWENFVTDGRTDGRQMEESRGQTDESDFLGCCPTNVEHPTSSKAEDWFFY